MNDSYQISSSLVNRLIAAIIIAIISIGGYMIVWAINDAQWKGRLEERWMTMEKFVKDFREHEKKPCHDVACEKLKSIKNGV